MGIIDSLSAGFDLVRRRPWLIVIPVVIDLFLWLGPRISVEPLVERLQPLLVAPSSASLSEADLEALQMSRDALVDLGRHFNLASLLPNTFLGVPSAMTGDTVAPVFTQPAVWDVSSGWAALALAVVLLVGSVFIAGLYLGLVGELVGGSGPGGIQALRRFPVYAGRILLLGLALLLVLVLFLIPVAIVSIVLAFVSQALALMWVGMMSLAAMWVSIAVTIYLFFAVDAMILFDDGVLAAVRNSALVVRRNLWSVLGLILLTNLISAGLGFVWQRLAIIPWGAAIGIVGNAYVGSGLVAAVFLFYRDRFTRLQADLKEARSAAERVR